MSERGLQVKSDVITRQSEASEFPQLCEGCLGENPYIRMQKLPFGGTCKMCDRPFTMFKWRPGRGEGYKKTEVCQICAKLKNICQTCILDLQYGLPSQLRDAVLSEIGNTPIPESDVGKEFQARKHIMMLENGEDPWQDQKNPNELLLDVARSAVENREQFRVKLPTTGTKRSHKDAFEARQVAEAEIKAKQADESLKIIANEDFSLPPGVSDIATLKDIVKTLPTHLNEIKSDSLNHNQSIVSINTGNIDLPSVATKKPLPPKPPGPPPAWAFKNNPQSQ